MSRTVEHGHEDASALDRLTGLTAADFAREHWGERPLLTRRADDFDDLFSADAVDELVSDRAVRTPFVRMAREGAVLPPSEFTSSGGFGAEIRDQLDSAKVLEHFAEGATLVLQGLHRTWAPLAGFTRRLVAELGHPAQVNAYVTPASSRGFDPHYDTHDVFVIQLAGAKHWTIHEPVHRHPLADQPWTDHRAAVAARAREDPVIDAVFEPGDVLYLPRGWIHSAVATGGTSLHLTIGVRAATRHDLLASLLRRAAEDPRLRAPLPLGAGSGTADLSADLAATVSAMSHLVAAADGEGVRTALQQDFAGATRPAPVRPLATVDLMSRLEPTAIVGWRTALAARIVEHRDVVSVILATKTITLPREASPALRAVRDRDLPAGALPQLDEASSLVVVRRLLREGVLVPR